MKLTFTYKENSKTKFIKRDKYKEGKLNATNKSN